MMNIMNLKRLFLLIAVAFTAVGCYEEFGTVAPRQLYDDIAFEDMFPEAERISIAELKYAYNDKFGGISNIGVNSGWNNTKYAIVGEDIFEGHDVYIKGKVTSDDTEGNVYKSLYIQDETTGIELKLNNNVGVRYKKGTWVYVRLSGLYLGNYRMMLSLGGAPSESWNKAGEHKFYANSNIELQEVVDRYVFPGRKCEEGIKVGAFEEWQRYAPEVDIITVTPDNYEEVFSPAKIEMEGKFYGTEKTDSNGVTRKVFEISQRELMFGRLMRFEGLECHYAGVTPRMALQTLHSRAARSRTSIQVGCIPTHVLRSLRLGITGHLRRRLQAVASMARCSLPITHLLPYALRMAYTHCAQAVIHVSHVRMSARMARRQPSPPSMASMLRSLHTQVTLMTMLRIS